MNRKNLLIWVVILGLLAMGSRMLLGGKHLGFSDPKEHSYSSFVSDVQAGRVQSVEVQGLTLHVTLKNNRGEYLAIRPQIEDPRLMDDLISKGVDVKGLEPERPSFWGQLFLSLLPVFLLFGMFYYFMRQQGGGKGSNPFNFGQSRAKRMMEGNVKVTFNDVAGADSAKDDLIEIVDFLKNPQKYTDIGGKIPRGVLLSGLPGTGKTLLAKAVAGEAKVPFFFVSGSDFVEMFVGVGASRVRDMFAQAKKSSPCIVFIDEIDAVGRHRGTGYGGGSDEREQTLNQLLVEMDGFDSRSAIVVIAATNRPDVLDPALLRPGRFDRQVHVDLPDLEGRKAILEVHAKRIKPEGNLNFLDIAKGTVGFSGADLANLINEAALLAARAGKRLVDMASLESAKDRIIMGPERSKSFMSEEEKRLTAYHEAGHAIVGYYVPGHDELYKMTIIPRGRALGVTMFLPQSDKRSYSREYCLARLCVAFGGRVAEELIYSGDKITTGAENDIQQATSLARNMVTRWGFSESVGPLDYHTEEPEPFLGRTLGKGGVIRSERTLERIDAEVKRLVESGYHRAREILETHLDQLHLLSKKLIEHESIDKEDIVRLLEGRPMRAEESFGGDSRGLQPSSAGA